ncbi:MAG: substrate-binding domain-containing protein [Gammaproteobacteria bacterium]|nr:substrate-binding domain-containing protein [Gammaproteobacteria bacterium]
MRSLFNIFLVALITAVSLTVISAERFIILQSTTSTQNSGLLDHLIPLFKVKSGIDVRVIAVGTGQALRNARNGDGDVLLVHAKNAEEAFVAEGFGVRRFDLMFNDFVIVGPPSDPAGIRDAPSASAALARIAANAGIFTSRGDDSGTHRKEMALWAEAGIDAVSVSGTWYLETGSGMGTTLNVAVGLDAYALTDRATWLSFKNKRNFEILFEGDPKLFNQYGVILVNPEKHPRVKAPEGQAFIDWLLSPDGQSAIAAFEVNGQQLFYPNASTLIR